MKPIKDFSIVGPLCVLFQGYYKRVPEYFDIVERKTYGCFQVPMVHTVLLINLRHKISQKLAYTSPEGYSKPEDDIILFAQSALTAGRSCLFYCLINPFNPVSQSCLIFVAFLTLNTFANRADPYQAA